MQTLNIHQTREGLNGQRLALCGAKEYPTWLPHTEECSFHDGKSPCNCTERINCAGCAAEKKAAAERRAAKAQAQIEAQTAKLAGMDNVKIYDED